MRWGWRGLRVLGCALVMTSAALVAPAPASAAVLVDDAPVPSWRVDGRVYATVVVGDRVFVGGQFRNAVSTTGARVARQNLAAFSLATGELLGWRADAGSTVRAMVTDGNSLWLGGAFGRVAGRTASRVAKVDVATGVPDPGFAAGADNVVRALALDGDDLYAGGQFLTVNGQPRTRLAKLDAATGAVDDAFRATASSPVWGLAKNPVSDDLYAAGQFSTLSGAARNGVGAVSATSGAARGVVFGSAARPTLGLAVHPDGTRLYGAGGSGSNAAAAWDTSTGTRVWRQVTDGDIQAVAYHDDVVWFGFHDGYQQDTSLKLLAADAGTGQLQSFYPRFTGFWGVFAIAVTDAGLVAGGEFTAVSGVAAQGFVRFPALSEPRSEPVSVSHLNATTRWSYWDHDSRPDGWHTTGFDDTGWPTGLAQLGYGDGDEATVIHDGGDPADRNVTAYFRTRFDVAEVPDVLRLEILADDGAVVYLNGVEVVRDNMVLDGPITHETLARSLRSGGPENALRPYSINPDRLRLGTNVLAVEVHQGSVTSDDLGLDVELTAQFLDR